MPEPQPLPVVIVACQVFQDLLEHFLPPDLTDQITFLDYGLHIVPKKTQADRPRGD